MQTFQIKGNLKRRAEILCVYPKFSSKTDFTSPRAKRPRIILQGRSV